MHLIVAGVCDWRLLIVSPATGDTDVCFRGVW